MVGSMDYTIFYKTSYSNGIIDCGDGYDFFFSSFDGCERTTSIFDTINSDKKTWIKFPHFQLDFDAIDGYLCTSFKEDECFIDLFSSIDISKSSKVCVDITGFIRPHLIFFIKYLHRLGLRKIYFLYSEPIHYKHAEDTTLYGFFVDVIII